MSNLLRRKFLKSIAAAGGGVMAGKALPESWTRPVVESVLLPAHAQLSQQAAVYDIQCDYYNVTPLGMGVYNVDFGYTPTDSSGALNNQLVNTVYVVTDQNNTVLAGPTTIVNSRFAVATGPAVNVNNPVGFIRVTTTFSNQATYGTNSCVQQQNV